MSENMNNHTLDVSAWFNKGYTVEPIKTFADGGQVEGIFVRLNSGPDDEKEPISTRYTEIAAIADSEGYLLFLAQVNPENHREVDVLLMPHTILGSSFSEFKTLETLGVLDLHAKHLLGSRDKLRNLALDMQRGNIDTGLEFFDVFYDVSFIQAMMAKEELDTAVLALLVALEYLVMYKSEEDRLSISIDLVQSARRGYLTKDNRTGNFAKLTEYDNIQGLVGFLD